MVSEKLKALVKVTDLGQIRSERKAITALFPYAVWQERDGKHETLNAFLCVVGASKWFGFMWNHVGPLLPMLLNKESHISLKWESVLVSPHLRWWSLPTSKHLIQPLAAAASAIPYTNEVGMSVVDTLLQIASDHSLRPYIPLDMWSWLNTHPPLPPVCRGRYLAGLSNTLQIVRALRDIETLKSFLLLVWSEWNGLYFEGLEETYSSIRDDLSEIEMWHHRKDLNHLDHVLAQLNLGLEHLRQHDPEINEDGIQQRKDQYGILWKVLLEVDMEATEMLICEPLRMTILFCLLTSIDRYKTPLNVYVCSSPPVSIVVCLGYSLPLP